MSDMSIVLMTLAFAAIGLAVVVGVILAYHWVRYSMNMPLALITLALYAGISLVLITLLFAATAAYTSAV